MTSDTTTPFTIESGIPIPADQGGRPTKYPFAQMQIGDSIFLSGNAGKCLALAARNRGRTHGLKFTSSKVDGGIRVWRVA